MNTSSEEYRKLYNEGKIAAYDKETDAYIAPELPEYTIKDSQTTEKNYSEELFFHKKFPIKSSK